MHSNKSYPYEAGNLHSLLKSVSRKNFAPHPVSIQERCEGIFLPFSKRLAVVTVSCAWNVRYKRHLSPSLSLSLSLSLLLKLPFSCSIALLFLSPLDIVCSLFMFYRKIMAHSLVTMSFQNESVSLSLSLSPLPLMPLTCLFSLCLCIYSLFGSVFLSSVSLQPLSLFHSSLCFLKFFSLHTKTQKSSNMLKSLEVHQKSCLY